MRALILFLTVSRAAWGACAAGDILWVKETVAANTLGTCNSFAAPFGIQRAFRELAAAATPGNGIQGEIRIVRGVNNYGPASASWAGRDDGATDPTIYVDSISGAEAHDPVATPSWIKVTGYLDQTTPCALSSGTPLTNCPVTLDFDKASFLMLGSIPGIEVDSMGGGFMDSYVWQWIRVTNSIGHGWRLNGNVNRHIFYRCRADNNGDSGTSSNGDGFRAEDGAQIQHRFVANQADSNFGAGFNINGEDHWVLYNKAFSNNVAGNGFAGGFSLGGTNGIFRPIVIGNASWGNIGAGILTTNDSPGSLLINNTSRLNTNEGGGSLFGDGIAFGATQDTILMFNIMAGNARYGLLTSPAGASVMDIVEGNNYGGNTTAPVGPAMVNANVALIDIDRIGAGAEDVSVVTFTSASNPTPTGGTADVTFYYAPSTSIPSTFQKGAIQVGDGLPGGSGCCWTR
jgi:hypothetical protein